jgi:hypothetical protein
MALCVYYLNYGTSFDDGEIRGGSPITMVARGLSIVAIVWALGPFNFRTRTGLVIGLTYFTYGAGMLIAAGTYGSINDTFFVNTLLQIPVVIALISTTRHIDYARWLHFIAVTLAVQTGVDTALWMNDASLWLSAAFIGGVGNPSSFGLYCSVLFAFCLFHPQAGRARWLLAAILGFGAVMSKALFAVLAVAVVLIAWSLLSWRRAVSSIVAVMVAAAIAITLFAGAGENGEGSFIEHKLNAVGALIGLVEYDVDSSASVSQRVEMHQQTFSAIVHEPWRLVFGHLEGKPYWPMDSQLLTYLGSFGAPMLLIFLSLHLWWFLRALRLRRVDGGFAAWSLALFGLIFSTNRILDYFPVAMLYFLLIAMVMRYDHAARIRGLNAGRRAGSRRLTHESTGSSVPSQ